MVESTPTPLFFMNSRIDIVGFVNPHKVVGRSAFSKKIKRKTKKNS
jgi:hypothetical protein